MEPARVLDLIRSAGGELTLTAAGLRVIAPRSVLDRVRGDIRLRKDEIVVLLSARGAGRTSTLRVVSTWDTEDWRVLYGERAAIMEYDGGLTRQEAELASWECCISAAIRKIAPTAETNECAGCGADLHGVAEQVRTLPDKAVVHYGGIWSTRCWVRYLAERRRRAAAELERLGLLPPNAWEP